MTTAAESALIAILAAHEHGDENDIDRACTDARAMYEDGGPLNFHARIEVESRMWCQLMLDDLAAKSAWAKVQENAEMYLDLGLLDLEKVLDAFKIDENEWQARVERNRQRKADNIAASRERERLEAERQQMRADIDAADEDD